ncbi:MAG: right-handed parallel beta-helix repeat-containing protein, partial [bacterium]
TLLAQPQISGPQSGTLGPGTYLVIGDISVESGQTLTVLPGTTLLHNGNHTWMIYGQLNADGSDADSIQFIRQSAISDHEWGGIRFQSGASDASTLTYCVIDHCTQDGSTPYAFGAAVFCNGVDLAINHCRISNCSNVFDGGGIYAVNSAVSINYCEIVDNISDNDNNGGGIYLMMCSGAEVTHCTVARNEATGT